MYIIAYLVQIKRIEIMIYSCLFRKYTRTYLFVNNDIFPVFGGSFVFKAALLIKHRNRHTI